MMPQSYLARRIVEGRIHTDQDHALLRTVALARQDERRERRARRQPKR